MVFVPTAWTNDGLPAITGPQLNRMEQGIKDAHDGIANALVPPLVTTAAELPAAPTAGQEVIFNTGGGRAVLWRLRWVPGWPDGYGWMFEGGPPMTHEVDGSDVINSSAGYIEAPTNPGPQLQLILPGVYRIAGSANINCPAVNASGGLVNPKFGGAAVADNDLLAYLTNNAAVILRGMSNSVPIERTLGANCLVKLTYKTANANGVTFASRRLEITPVRLGKA